MKIVLVGEKSDTSSTVEVIIRTLRRALPSVKVYIGSQRMYDYEHALTHGADGWIDIPKDNSGQEQ